MTILKAIEALTKSVTAFPPEERCEALIRLIDSWEEVHLRRNTPMPMILHLMRRDFAWIATYDGEVHELPPAGVSV